MAKQTGILPISGTLDGVNFYLRKGKPIARKAGGGFDGKKIKSSPEMKRVRENGSEFGHCSRVKKVFKDGLFPFFKNYKNADLHRRMMQLFLAIKDLDLVSNRGERNLFNGLQNLDGKKLLKQFHFTTMPFPFTTAVYNSSLYELNITPFIVNDLPFPNNSSGIVIEFGVLVLNFEELKATLYKSDDLIINRNENGIDFRLTLPIFPNENGIRISVISYQYIQEVNNAFYRLNESNCFGLKVVGVD